MWLNRKNGSFYQNCAMYCPFHILWNRECHSDSRVISFSSLLISLFDRLMCDVLAKLHGVCNWPLMHNNTPNYTRYAHSKRNARVSFGWVSFFLLFLVRETSAKNAITVAQLWFDSVNGLNGWKIRRNDFVFRMNRWPTNENSNIGITKTATTTHNKM